MKIIIKLIFLYFIFANFIIADSNNKEIKVIHDIKTIKDSGKLRIAMTQTDQSPFFFVKDGILQGLDIELANELSTELNVEAVFIRTADTFDDVINLVNTGEADIAISKISRTLKRSELVYFSKPYMILRQGLLINRIAISKFGEDESKKGIKNFLSIFNGGIGVLKSSSYVTFAKNFFPNAEITEFENWDDVVHAVSNNRIGIAYRDELEIKKIIKGNPEAVLNLKTVIISDVIDDIAIAINRDNTQLKNYIDIFLDKKRLNLNAEKLLNKYPEIFDSINTKSKKTISSKKLLSELENNNH